MSKFTDAVGRATDALRRRPTAKAREAVLTDRFDAEIFDDTVAQAPRLAELVEAIPLPNEHAHDLVRDVFLQFWQSAPSVRTREDMDPARLINQAVVSTIVNSPDAERLHRIATHDRYAAAMSTVAVGNQIMDVIGAQQQQAEAGQQAAKDAQDAADEAAEALAGLAGAEEGDDDVAAQIEAAIAAWQAAQDNADEAQADAEDQIERAQRAAQAATNRAVGEAIEKLEHEASMMSSWGIGRDEVEQMDFATREALMRSLSNTRVSKYLALLGRFRAMAAAARAKRVEYVRSEVTGIELSDRLPDVLPGELALRVNRHTRLEFLARLTGGRLATYAFHGEENIGHGPVVVNVDCSDSMRATDVAGIPREVWAKGFTLAMIEHAHKARRDMVIILFSGAGQQRVFTFPRGVSSVADKIAVVQDFFAGGTDYEQPIDMAIDIIRKDFNDTKKPRADIVTITDDTIGVGQSWLTTYLELKDELDFRHFGIAVGVQVGTALRAMCDNVRSVHEFADPTTVADIFQVVT